METEKSLKFKEEKRIFTIMNRNAKKYLINIKKKKHIGYNKI